MKEIEQIVTDYLRAENTDYALMINGDWGCGKSYYVKRNLFSVIASINCTIVEEVEPVKYEPLYISLYGITDIHDILYKIQLELNSWMKSKAWGLFRGAINKAAAVIGTDVSKEDEKEILSAFSIKKNKILFFDDLERIDTNKISFSSVLGQINHFTEQDNLKVIIICNSSETDQIFNQIHEKTIRFSCLYNPFLGDVFDNMILSYIEEYAIFLRYGKHTILSIFETAKYKNLRTLRFILDIFQKIYNQVKHVEYKDEILKRFLFFSTIYTVEYKLGLYSKEDLLTLKNVGPYSLIDFDFDFLVPDGQKDSIDPNNIKPSYSQSFSEKYSEIIESFHYCQEIADYIHNGYLDVVKFICVVDEIIQEIKRSEGTEEDKLIKEIRNWRELKDEDFDPLKEKVIKKIDEGKFSLIAYPVIFAEFLQFEFYKLDDFKITEEFINRFKKGIDKSKETHKYIEALRYKFPIWSDRDTTPARGNYLQICNYVIDANDYALTKEYVSISDTILAHLEQNKSKELQEVIIDPSNLNSPFFENLDVAVFFEFLLKANNQTIYAFNESIFQRYSDSDINHEPVFQREREFFEKLHKLIVEYIDSVSQRKISTVQFIDLEKNLKRFVKKQ